MHHESGKLARYVCESRVLMAVASANDAMAVCQGGCCTKNSVRVLDCVNSSILKSENGPTSFLSWIRTDIINHQPNLLTSVTESGVNSYSLCSAP